MSPLVMRFARPYFLMLPHRIPAKFSQTNAAKAPRAAAALNRKTYDFCPNLPLSHAQRHAEFLDDGLLGRGFFSGEPKLGLGDIEVRGRSVH